MRLGASFRLLQMSHPSFSVGEEVLVVRPLKLRRTRHNEFVGDSFSVDNSTEIPAGTRVRIKSVVEADARLWYDRYFVDVSKLDLSVCLSNGDSYKIREVRIREDDLRAIHPLEKLAEAAE